MLGRLARTREAIEAEVLADPLRTETLDSIAKKRPRRDRIAGGAAQRMPDPVKQLRGTQLGKTLEQRSVLSVVPPPRG